MGLLGRPERGTRKLGPFAFYWPQTVAERPEQVARWAMRMFIHRPTLLRASVWHVTVRPKMIGYRNDKVGRSRRNVRATSFLHIVDQWMKTSFLADCFFRAYKLLRSCNSTQAFRPLPSTFLQISKAALHFVAARVPFVARPPMRVRRSTEALATMAPARRCRLRPCRSRQRGQSQSRGDYSSRCSSR